MSFKYKFFIVCYFLWKKMLKFMVLRLRNKWNEIFENFLIY